ncbi:PRC-barrel domain-containing protein [Cellulosimicrobium cellulans]|uniref:PRC-barrel domain-containing protein n=1 Tax=Cellulosimicrobium cellulans TaxID=1710 RepID=UPI0036EF5F4B
MISTDQIERLLSGGTVVSQAGEKVGKVGQVFLDDHSGEPEWVTVKTGLFGTAESFVPLADADVQGDEIRVPYTKDTVKGAPRVDDSEGHLSLDEEAELYRYYGRRSTSTDADASHDESSRGEGAASEGVASDGAAGDEGVVGRHAAGPPTDDAAAAPGGLRPAPGAATGDTYRLRRYVVTEYIAEAVPADAVPPAPEPREASATGDASTGDASREEHRS